ncbi:hypothetical protein DFH28DRAFT_529057 [Melampsora americana]|nr:hypothetical protein DFH28DRAFT_529057 [Melampsora americana]
MYNSKRLLNLLFAVSIAVHLAAGYAIENKRQVEILHKEPSYHGPAQPPYIRYERPVEHHADMLHKGEHPKKEHQHKHHEGPAESKTGHKGHELSYAAKPGPQEGKPHPNPPPVHDLEVVQPSVPGTPLPEAPLTDPVPPQYSGPKPKGPPPPRNPGAYPVKELKPKVPEESKPLTKPSPEPVPPKYVSPKPIEPPTSEGPKEVPFPATKIPIPPVKPIPSGSLTEPKYSAPKEPKILPVMPLKPPAPGIPAPDKKPTPPVEVPSYKSPIIPVTVPENPIKPMPVAPIEKPTPDPVEISPVKEIPSYGTGPPKGVGVDHEM